MKDYQVAEWEEMVEKAKHRLKHSSCPLIEDEVLVAVDDQRKLYEPTKVIRQDAHDLYYFSKSITQEVIEVEAAKSDQRIQQKLIDMGWTPPEHNKAWRKYRE